MLKLVDENSFNEHVRNSRGITLINFWAWWSEECRNMHSIMCDAVNLIDDENVIVYIDWDQQKGLGQKLEVCGVPTLLFYINGRELTRCSGTMKKSDLIKRITEAKRR